MKKIFLITAVSFNLIFSGCITAEKTAVVQPLTEQNTNETAETKPIDLENLKAKVPILIYHHIREISDKDKEKDKQFIVSPENFEKQLQYLKENDFQNILLKDLANYFSGNFTLPAKPIIITFDDGLISQYNNALPLLQKYGFTATFFIFTNPIGRSQNYLNWEQIKELENFGIEIGSHGIYHLLLNKIDKNRLAEETSGSKEKIEENLGQKIYSFAYPFGAYNDQVVKMIKEAGYQSARDIVNGVNHTKENLYNLRAYFITDNFPRFKNIVNQ